MSFLVFQVASPLEVGGALKVTSPPEAGGYVKLVSPPVIGVEESIVAVADAIKAAIFERKASHVWLWHGLPWHRDLR